MTIKEVKELLDKYEDDQPVVFHDDDLGAYVEVSSAQNIVVSSSLTFSNTWNEASHDVPPNRKVVMLA